MQRCQWRRYARLPRVVNAITVFTGASYRRARQSRISVRVHAKSTVNWKEHCTLSQSVILPSAVFFLHADEISSVYPTSIS